MTLKEKYGSTALIAGASEGIGAAFATLLAAEGIDLVLVARRITPLERLAATLIEKYGVTVLCISADLSENGVLRQIEQDLDGKNIDILIYNAALSYLGPFITNPPEEHLKAANVNILTQLQMVQLYGSRMILKGKGAVILMSSLAGFQGSGYLSFYAASKAFSRILAESLWYEWKDKGVDVIACCAGATSTPGYINSNPEKTGFFTPRVLSPEEVAGECLSNLGKKPSFITGRGNRIASFIMQKLLPRKLAIKIMGDNTKKMYRL